MTTLNISLPDNLREWIDNRVKKGDYSSASDYMRDLVRIDKKKNVNLDEFLLEGIDSGEALEATPVFWEKKHQQLKRDIHARK
jgi:antitoxin ParD1/3/4